MINLLLLLALGGCPEDVPRDVPDTVASLYFPLSYMAVLYHKDSTTVYPVEDSGLRVGNDGDTLLGEYRLVVSGDFCGTMQINGDDIDGDNILLAELYIEPWTDTTVGATDSIICAANDGSFRPSEATWIELMTGQNWNVKGGISDTTYQVKKKFNSDFFNVTNMVKYQGITSSWGFIFYSTNHTNGNLLKTDKPILEEHRASQINPPYIYLRYKTTPRPN